MTPKASSAASGRSVSVAAAAGIVLLALSARTALTATSPIIGTVSEVIGADRQVFATIGALAPLLFAAAGFLASPALARCRPERSALVIAGGIGASLGLRSIAGDGVSFAVLTVLALAGMGAANVLLPALARAFFSQRLGLATSITAGVIALSTALPPLVSERLAGGNWRLGLAVWALVAVLGAAPWTWVAIIRRQRHAPVPAAKGSAVRPRGFLRTGVIFSIAAGTAFAMFAWLPTIAREALGLDPLGSAALLSLYAVMALPVGLIIPPIANRMRSLRPLIVLGVLLTFAGLVTLASAPAFAVPATVVAGAGQLLYPTTLMMIARSSTSPREVARQSGLAQSTGYALAALGPLVLTAGMQAAGGWPGGLLTLAACVLLAGIGVLIPHRRRESTGRRARPLTT